MFLEIVTPEASIFKGDVEVVTVPGVNGEFQMLENHAAIVSLLQEGKVKFKGDYTLDEEHEDKFTKVDSNTSALMIQSGTVELKDNKVIILVD